MYKALRVPRTDKTHWTTLARERDKWKDCWRPLAVTGTVLHKYSTVPCYFNCFMRMAESLTFFSPRCNRRVYLSLVPTSQERPNTATSEIRETEETTSRHRRSKNSEVAARPENPLAIEQSIDC
ncbi:hypothetical protein ANCDUO_00143 [Ancylostoma duodenale]|uniref:Uncharacterized protein n=1 Tax=Ancylostoma duodenale TaxID=51022 RepID=A0A0C2HCS5_9BILA|nr:hypothetical protein ANCDUO_00143 [Ancylostoma duodenale]